MEKTYFVTVHFSLDADSEEAARERAYQLLEVLGDHDVFMPDLGGLVELVPDELA